MMFLFKIRNVLIVTLVVLSFSFMYIGVSNWGDKYKIALDDGIIDELNETTQVVATKTKDKDKNSGGKKVINEGSNSSNTAKGNSFFVDFRMKRERDNASQIEVLEAIVENPQSSSEVRTEAQEELLVISKNIALESKIENLLKAKEYTEAVAVVQNNTVTIIIKANTLKESDVSKLGDLVISASGFTLEDISIIPKK